MPPRSQRPFPLAAVLLAILVLSLTITLLFRLRGDLISLIAVGCLE